MVIVVKTKILLAMVMLCITCKPYEGQTLEEVSAGDDGWTSATITLEHSDLKITLPSDLAQEKISTANLEFIPGDNEGALYSTFVLGLADANNVTSPVKSDDSAELIRKIGIDILLGDDTSLCPDGSFIVELISEDETTDDIVLGQTDVPCGGNRFSEINNLTQRLAEKITGSSNTFQSLTREDYEETYNKAKGLVEQESEGFLEKNKDKDLTKKFLLHYKMLDAYHKMRQALSFPDANPTIEGGWTDRLYDFIGENAPKENDHQTIPNGIIIPSLLNGFLNPQVNKISLGTQIDENEELESRVAKQALKIAIARFLHYQYVFEDNNVFENWEFSQKFDNINWHSSLREFVQEIVDKVNSGFQELNENAEAKANSKLTINEIHTVLSSKISELSSFMRNEQQNGKGCKEVLAEYYHQFATPLKNETISDALILLNSRHIMHRTGIHEPCKKYGDFFENNLDHNGIKDAVIGAKEAIFKHIENLNNNFNDRQDGDFLVNLVKENYNALVPVLTEDPTKIDSVVNVLRESEREAIKERKKDIFWQNILGMISGALAAIGIVVAIALFAISPIFPPIALAGSAVLGFSLVGGASLTVMYGWNYWQERGQYHELERQIFSGANADTSEAARSYSQWRKAKFAAITEGIFTGVGVAGGGLKFVANPQDGVRGVTKTIDNVGSYWQKTREARQGKKIRDLRPSGVWKDTKATFKKGWAGIKGIPRGIKDLGSDVGRNVKEGVMEFKNIKKNYRETWKMFDDWKGLRKLAKEHGGKVRVHPNYIRFVGEKGRFIKENKPIMEHMRTLKATKNTREGFWHFDTPQGNVFEMKRIGFSGS